MDKTIIGDIFVIALALLTIEARANQK